MKLKRPGRQLLLLASKMMDESSQGGDGEASNPYELERAARIRRNKQVLQSLGLAANVIDAAAASRSSRKPAPGRAAPQPEAAEAQRRSRRLQGAEAAPVGPPCGSDSAAEGPAEHRRAAQRAAVSARLPASGSDPCLAEHNLHRVRTMTDRALQTRVWKIQRVDKLQSFIQVLEACGKGELAAEAAQALEQLCSGGGSAG